MSESAARTRDYLYLSIYRSLKERIVSGEYRKGERFPPERQLKDEYDTTHVTVRRALSMLVEEGYIERYSGKGTVVVFEAGNRSAPVPVSVPTRRVRLLVPGLDSPRRGLLGEWNRICGAFNLDFSATVFTPETEESTLARVAADASLLLVYEPLNPDFRFESYLSDIRSRVILTGAATEVPPGFCGVFFDIDQAVRETAGHIRGLGHRSMALVGRPSTRWGRAFSAAFRKAAAAEGLTDSETAEVDGMGLYSGGEQAARALAEELPDCRGFICSDDESASGLLGYFNRRGGDPAENRIIIGCGNDPFSEALKLSSLDPDHRCAGELFGRWVDEFLRRGTVPPSGFLVRPHLILRRP